MNHSFKTKEEEEAYAVGLTDVIGAMLDITHEIEDHDELFRKGDDKAQQVRGMRKLLAVFLTGGAEDILGIKIESVGFRTFDKEGDEVEVDLLKGEIHKPYKE